MVTDDIVVLVTASNEDEARNIADLLIKKRRVACVNIIPRVDSVFWWQDKPDVAQESLMVIKTRSSVFNEIIALVKEMHSYQVPEIIALPIVAGNEDYLRWLKNSVKSP